MYWIRDSELLSSYIGMLPLPVWYCNTGMRCICYRMSNENNTVHWHSWGVDPPRAADTLAMPLGCRSAPRGRYSSYATEFSVLFVISINMPYFQLLPTSILSYNSDKDISNVCLKLLRFSSTVLWTTPWHRGLYSTWAIATLSWTLDQVQLYLDAIPVHTPHQPLPLKRQLPHQPPQFCPQRPYLLPVPPSSLPRLEYTRTLLSTPSPHSHCKSPHSCSVWYPALTWY